MPSCNIGDPELTELLDRYQQGRIKAHVAEDSGERFDVALTVDGIEIACLRLRGGYGPVLLYSNRADEPSAIDNNGALVPLPIGRGTHG